MPDLLGSNLPPPVQREKIVFSTGSGNSIPVNTTTYLYCNLKGGEISGNIGVETLVDMNYLVLRPGTLKNLVAHTNDVPGAGQTYTYTVRINGAPTAITCITGAASRDSSDLVNTAKVVAGNRVTVQAVTSLTATATRHAVCLQVEYPIKRPFEGLYFTTGTGTVAAGLTRYLGTLYMKCGFGLSALSDTITIMSVIYLCVRKGSLKNLVVYAPTPPGAAQTFTYAVLINTVPSALTCTISGAVAVSAQDLTNVVQVDPGDLIVVRIMNSAGGAVGTHAAYLDFEEGDYLA